MKAGKKDGFVLHDARRSSARSKRVAGVSPRVIMQMQGWKTEAMFRRYAIVDQSDTKRALALEAEQRDAALKTNDQLQYSYSGPVSQA